MIDFVTTLSVARESFSPGPPPRGKYTCKLRPGLARQDRQVQAGDPIPGKISGAPAACLPIGRQPNLLDADLR
jgi:hypothetical protein